jgi:hypothetical protein
MPDELRKAKLNREQKDFVLQMLAREHHPQVIVEELKQQYSITVSNANICAYRKKFVEILKEKRRMFLESMGGVPLFEKAERLAELQKMYDYLVKQCNGNYSLEVRDKQSYVEILQGLIEQIQKEVEPLKIQGEGFANNSPVFIIQSNGHEPKTADKSQDISKRFRFEPSTLSGNGLGLGDRKNNVRDS